MKTRKVSEVQKDAAKKLRSDLYDMAALCKGIEEGAVFAVRKLSHYIDGHGNLIAAGVEVCRQLMDFDEEDEAAKQVAQPETPTYGKHTAHEPF